MKKFVAFAVATLFTAGASVAMAQCPSCSGSAAPVFSSAPVYSAPAPVYSAPAPVYSQPVYAAPVAAAPVYSEPVAAAPVYSEPIVSSPAPIYSAPVSSCGCGSTGGEVVYGGMVSGEATYTGGEFTSYGSEAPLTVGSVINGETVVSVGESEIVGTTDPGEASAEGNVIDGSVEPSPAGGEVIAPPTEESTPAPEEATEGDA